MSVPMLVKEPGGAPRGAVIVCHEAFGITEHIELVCERYAAAGYLTVVPAFFHRSEDPPPIVAYDDIPSAIDQMGRLDPDGVLADVDDAVALAAGRGIGAAMTGIVGFCMGGTIAYHVAGRRGLGSAVTFYGGGVAEGRMGFPAMVEAAGAMQTPWLGLFGDLDQSIPVEHVERLRGAVASANVPTDIVRYPDAYHGFHCDDRPAVFHAAAAADAHVRTLGWFATHMR